MPETRPPAACATRLGFRAAWINGSGRSPERLPAAPGQTPSRLADLLPPLERPERAS